MTHRAPAPPVWFIAIAFASAVGGMTLISPALPLVMADTGGTSTAVQLLLTAYLIALSAGQLIYGTVSDWLGRRPVLLFGAVLFSLGGIAAVFSNTIE
ncbi:MAG: MFS transporter, partial [Gammaproteobacteria bacterium]|nr:MFS transporter [Gammaproteobacteria bacterium]